VRNRGSRRSLPAVIRLAIAEGTRYPRMKLAADPDPAPAHNKTVTEQATAAVDKSRSEAKKFKERTSTEILRANVSRANLGLRGRHSLI
jgi:hypothetical protein